VSDGKPVVKGEYWLRHGKDTHCAVIDETLLEGRYSMAGMARDLNQALLQHVAEPLCI